MSFDDRYQLLELAEDLGVKSFVAREISTGRKVTVFLFVGEQVRLQADLLTRIHAVDRLQFPELIEIGDNRGTPYVVTQSFGGFSELKDRILHSKTSPPAPQKHKPEEFTRAGVWRIPPELRSASGSAETKPEAPAAAPSPPGSYTQMFQPPAPPIGESTVELVGTPQEKRATAPAELPVAEALFKSSQEPAPAVNEIIAETPEAPLQPAEVPPAQPAPGSFTQMFQAAAPPIGEAIPEPPKAPSKPAEPPPAPPAPGSFTQMFQAAAPPIGEAVPEPPKAPSKPAEPPPAPPAPGAFTQMFQAAAPPIGEAVPEPPKAPSKPAEPPPAQPKPGEFTQFFKAATSPDGEVKPEAPKVPPPPKAAPPSSQLAPGEFTRFFNAASSSSKAAPAPLPGKPEDKGDFARIFGGGERVTAPPSTGTGIFSASSSAEPPNQGGNPPAAAPPSAYSRPAGEFTQLFGSNPMAAPQPDSTLQPPAPAAPPPAASAPGEYTRMFGAQSVPQEPTLSMPPPAPKAVAETPVPAKQSSKMVPILIGVILLLLAAIAIVVITVTK